MDDVKNLERKNCTRAQNWSFVQKLTMMNVAEYRLEYMKIWNNIVVGTCDPQCPESDTDELISIPK